MNIKIVAVLLILLTILTGTVNAQQAQLDPLYLNQGESVQVSCLGGANLVVYVNGDKSTLECPEVSETVTVTATPENTVTVTPTALPTSTNTPPTPSDISNVWHSPAAHDGLNYHEHGDKPPAWVEEFISNNADILGTDHLVFGGDEGTNGENVKKHQGFKGYYVHFGGGDQYYRFHMMTTPLGQTGVFHSLEIYMRDPSGNVSFVQGWLNFAEGGTFSNNSDNFYQHPDNCIDPNYPFMHAGNPAGRPRIITNTLYCYKTKGIYTFESWYSDFHPILGETGVNSEDTYFFDGVPSDPSTWTTAPNNNKGLGRRVEANWTPEGKPQGWFVADQFGRIMNGMNDARCGSTVTAQGQSHTVLCLPQFISNTAIGFGFPGNSFQKTFPSGDGIELPN